MKKLSYHTGIHALDLTVDFLCRAMHLDEDHEQRFLGQEKSLRWCLSLWGAPGAAGAPLAL